MVPRTPLIPAFTCACLALVSGCADSPSGGRHTRKPGPGESAAASSKEGGVAGVTATVHAWECEGGAYVVTEFRAAPDEVFVFLPEGSLALPHVASASGAKYSDGTITLWTRGDEMVLDRGLGRDVSCTRNARRSRIESSKLAGYDIWATGNEPGWTLQIGYPGIVWETDYGETRYEAETPEPEEDAAARAAVYRTEADKAVMEITLLGETCRDDMSGEVFETTVIIEFRGRTYRGCGQPLH